MVREDIRKHIGDVFDQGELPTMVYISKQDVTHAKASRPLHSHDSICELLVFYEGTGSYRLGSQRYPLEEGCVVYYNQKDLHEVESDTDREIGHYCIGITNLHLKGLPRNHLVSKEGPFVRHAGSLYPFLRDLCEQIYTLEEMNLAGKLASQLLCASLIVIAAGLETFPQSTASGTKEEQFVARIWDYLNEHFTEDINLEKIARDLNCSAPYVSHSFKRVTGATPIQYVIRRRIGLAQTLLISTDLPATQIATMVGYGNTNYFCTLFHRIVGASPVAYRAQYLEKLRGRRDQS